MKDSWVYYEQFTYIVSVVGGREEGGKGAGSGARDSEVFVLLFFFRSLLQIESIYIHPALVHSHHWILGAQYIHTRGFNVNVIRFFLSFSFSLNESSIKQSNLTCQTSYLYPSGRVKRRSLKPFRCPLTSTTLYSTYIPLRIGCHVWTCHMIFLRILLSSSSSPSPSPHPPPPSASPSVIYSQIFSTIMHNCITTSKALIGDPRSKNISISIVHPTRT